MSNEAAVIADITVQNRLLCIEIEDGNLLVTKTLGVIWQTQRDVFTFCVQPPKPEKLSTKRNVLSGIAKLFDPLQFLTPFTLRTKILMQKV